MVSSGLPHAPQAAPSDPRPGDPLAGELARSAESPSEGDYTVSLAAFQGPLDLLLYLIRRAEVDIHDIPIATITDQFLAFVHRAAAHVDVEEAGEFLVMAATLIEIKARTLAPVRREGSDEEGAGRPELIDPRAELVQALLAYQRYRRAAEDLEAHRVEFWQRHPVRILPALPPARANAPDDAERGRAAEAGSAGEDAGGDGAAESFDDDEAESALELEDAHALDLLDAYERIAGAIDFARLGDHRVEYDDTPIALHQEDLLDRLGGAPLHRLSLQRVFEGRTRLEKIGLFLAMLELARQRRIRIEQRDEDPVVPGGRPATVAPVEIALEFEAEPEVAAGVEPGRSDRGE
ncbi:MAG TPA: segregation/condensation protein A [Phycisphaerales bacterium]|nr:segregation/condensation protein A [Phycisphaerales bacterium]HMP37862.1 segregation/condensation protein A [Phycisphaerales bacterium]